jgi:hypothetical protein
MAENPMELIRQFEQTKRERDIPNASGAPIQVECEECRKVSTFPPSLKGTTQNCPECNAFLDVGEVDWDEQESGE